MEELQAKLAKAIEEGERKLHRSRACVFKFRPSSLVVELDCRFGFGHRKLGSDLPVQMSVGEVMGYLAHGPASRTVRSVELHR